MKRPLLIIGVICCISAYTTATSAFVRGPNNEFIVGYDDPNEVHTISANYSLYGSLYLLNNATLIVENCDFEVIGSVYVLGDSQLIINSSAFTLMNGQDFHREIYVLGNSLLRMENSTLYTNKYSSHLYAQDHARVELHNSTEPVDNYSWVIAYFIDDATLDIKDSSFPDEIIPADNASIHIQNENIPAKSISIWLNFHYNETAVLTGLKHPNQRSTISILPDDPAISGINYSIVVEDTLVHWSVNPGYFSNITLVDSEVTLTLFLSGYDGKDFTNLATGFFKDWQVPLYDFERALFLKNTTIIYWQLYLAGVGNEWEETYRITDSSINELIVFDETFVRAKNSNFGPAILGTLYSGEMAITDSNIKSLRVIAHDTSKITLEASRLEGTEIIASSEASICLKNVILAKNVDNNLIPLGREVSMEAFGAGKISMAILDELPGSYTRGDNILFSGAAFMDVGPDSPVHFNNYYFEYSSDGGDSWDLIPGTYEETVFTGPLAIWNTANLTTSGEYFLKLVVTDTTGNSCEAFGKINLQ